MKQFLCALLLAFCILPGACLAAGAAQEPPADPASSEVAILPEEPPTMISYTTPEEIGFEVPEVSEASEPEATLPQTGLFTGRLLLPVGFGLLVGGRWLAHKAPCRAHCR